MPTDWTVIPDNPKEIEATRERCLSCMVRRRAVISAGVSAVPIPGVDVVSDLSLFKKLVDDVNEAFGLTEAQIDQMQPNHKLIAYKVAVGVGGVMVGKLVTRELLTQLFKRVGLKMMAKSASRFVPIALARWRRPPSASRCFASWAMNTSRPAPAWQAN
ncbi:hypothetical protein LP420_19560 [Massilia sp. B-10]|nr:hypothetical protein LP420_19560 [Massilia sp. B-10]